MLLPNVSKHFIFVLFSVILSVAASDLESFTKILKLIIIKNVHVNLNLKIYSKVTKLI